MENRIRYVWVVSDPKNPTKWPGLREQLRGIESFLMRDVIRWKYREKLMKLVAEMQLALCEHLPISGVEAYGEENGTRWLLVPKEELEDEDRDAIHKFLKVEDEEVDSYEKDDFDDFDSVFDDADGGGMHKD